MKEEQPAPPINAALLEILNYDEPGYLPQVDFGAWRVAVLNYCPELRPEALDRMQRHDETDEVFVLLQGRCVLLVGDGDAAAGNISAADLRPGTVYNVKRGVWHTHALSEDAKVLVVENRDTTLDNSPFCDLSDAQRTQVVAAVQAHWFSP